MKVPTKRRVCCRNLDGGAAAGFMDRPGLLCAAPVRVDPLDGPELEEAMLPAACFLGECCHRKSSLQRQLELPPLNRKARDAPLEEAAQLLGYSSALHKHTDCALVQDPVTALHQQCASADPRPGLGDLCRRRPHQVAARNAAGQTPLHVLLLCQSRGGRWPVVRECCQTLLAAGAPLDVADQEDDTPLLYLRSFLAAGHSDMAAQLAQLLLAAGAAPDAVNRRGRSLLMYCAERGDPAAALTRALLNGGASVRATPRASAFGALLSGVVARRRLDDSDVTLALICRQMARRPQQMRAHVLAVMVSQGEHYRLLAPLFLELKRRVRRYWAQPRELRQLCCETVRRCLQAGGGVAAGAAQLSLPPALRRAVTMEDTT